MSTCENVDGLKGKYMKSILLILILVALSSCDISTEYSRRSGDLENDYVEEPLSEAVVKYAETVETANLFIEAIKNADYLNAYQLCDKNIQNQLSESEFAKLLTKDEAVIGKINEFKKNQWSFDFETKDKVAWVNLTKIVKHEKLAMHYTFIFVEGGNYSKILGFSFREKTGLLM